MAHPAAAVGEVDDVPHLPVPPVLHRSSSPGPDGSGGPTGAHGRRWPGRFGARALIDGSGASPPRSGGRGQRHEPRVPRPHGATAGLEGLGGPRLAWTPPSRSIPRRGQKSRGRDEAAPGVTPPPSTLERSGQASGAVTETPLAVRQPGTLLRAPPVTVPA